MNDEYRKMEEIKNSGEEKAIIFHGFSHEELNLLIRTIKKVPDAPKDIIRAVTTPTSLEWKVKDLIEELSKEHRYFREKKENIK